MKSIMAKKVLLVILSVVLLLTCVPGCDKSDENVAGYSQEVVESFINDPKTLPISFKYDGTEYKGLNNEFTEVDKKIEELDDRINYDVSYSFKETGVIIRVEYVAYKDYKAYEWTVYFENQGTGNSGIFSDILGLDREYKGKNPILKGINGDTGDMYAPYEVELTDNKVKKESTSGRPTHGVFPYFNLEYGNGGTFIAVGWSGCWKTYFENKNTTTTVKAGQYNISTYLQPGESIRTPLMAFLEYDGRDELKNMNTWRSWFIYCNMHRDQNDNVIQPVFAYSSMSQGSNATSFKRIINTYYAHGININYVWMDAGWYVNAKDDGCGWTETGTWEVNESMFPEKFNDISTLIHNNGGKTLLWFEPEVVRCNKSDFLLKYSEFKEEWFLGTAASGSWLEGQLINLGDEDARNWLLARIFKVMDEGGIDMYRQDFNVDPAPVWNSLNTEGRVGIVENKYVVGYLDFWDAILAKYPNMASIDSCASGGGRNDLESLRRAVMLHVSDFWDGNSGGWNERQAVALSLASWIPYFKLEKGTGVDENTYLARSVYAPWTNFNVSTMSKSTDWDLIKKEYDEWKQLSRLYYSDYYPLTNFSKGSDVWRAWEYNDEYTGKCAVQCFRGENATENSITLKLHGLSNCDYEVKDTDGNINEVINGKILCEKGLTVTLENPGSAAVIFITKK